MLQELLLRGGDKKPDYGSTQRFAEIVQVLRQHDLVTGITPVKIRQVFEALGPTFVKLGQVLSMRPDFLPQDYCEELTKLQTEVNPLPFAEIQEIIEKEYACPLGEIFSRVEEKSLGSASIAQVHKAYLLDGRPVVIKVQRPGIYDIMAQDILLLKRAAVLLKIISDSQDVIDFNLILDEIWAIAKQEMDFLMEADHIDEFSQLNSDEAWVACPKVERQLTTPRILVMEFIDGIRIDDFASLEAKGFDRMQLGRRLGENYVRQLLEDGYFHADPHPGNIWIKDGKIIWLDLGMMGRLSAKDKASIRKAVFALVNHDTYEMKAAVLALGVTKGRVNHAKLYEDIDALLGQYNDIDFRALQMGVLTQQIMNVLRLHHIGIGPGLSMFARGVLTIEGVLRHVCPEVSFVELLGQSMQLDFNRNFDWREELSRLKRESYMLFKKSMQLPEQFSDILQMTMSGQTKVNFELTGSEEPLNRVDRMINKLIIGIISSALLLGSSVICTTQMTPKIMEIPLLGVFGYLAAVLLCMRLLWEIINNK